MVDIVERPFVVGIENPLPPPHLCGDIVDSGDGIVSPPSWPEPITARLKASLSKGLKRALHPCLQSAVTDRGDGEGAAFRLPSIYILYALAMPATAEPT